MEKVHTTSKIRKALLMAGATLAMGGFMLTSNAQQAEASTWDERPLTAIQEDIQEVKDSNTVEYQIQWGDTLGNIAKALGIEVSTLANANGIENIDVIIAGQYIVISEDEQGHTKVEVNEVSTQPQAQVTAPKKAEPKKEVKQEVAQPKQEVKQEVAQPKQEAPKESTSTGYLSSREAFNQVVAEKGVSQSEANAWAELIRRESNWDATAKNPSSGAYGLPQSLPASKMASHGDIHDPVVQLRWMFDYVQNRYGSFSQAINHSNQVGWY